MIITAEQAYIEFKFSNNNVLWVPRKEYYEYSFKDNRIQFEGITITDPSYVTSITDSINNTVTSQFGTLKDLETSIKSSIGDTTAPAVNPVFVSANVGDVNNTTIDVVFDQSLASGNTDGGITLNAAGGPLSVVSSSIYNGNLRLVVDRVVAPLEDIYFSYVSSGTNPLQSITGTYVGNITNEFIDNTLVAPAPTVMIRQVTDIDKNQVQVNFDRTCTGTTLGWFVYVNGVEANKIAFSGTGTTQFIITLDSNVANGDTVTLSYNSSLGDTVATLGSVPLATFTNSSVTNNVQASESLGSELVVNGNMTAWTAGEPDNYTVYGTDGTTKKITEDTGKAKWEINGDGMVYISQEILTVGKTYRIQGEISDYVSGTAYMSGFVNGYSAGVISGAGIFSFDLVAESTVCYWMRLNRPNFTMDNLSVREVLTGVIQDPVLQSASISDSEPNKIQLVYDLDLDNTYVDTSNHTVSGGRTVTAVAINQYYSTVELTVDTAYEDTDSVTVSYDNTNANKVETSAGGVAASLTNQAVTNSITNPRILSATINDLSKDKINITVDEALNATYTSAPAAFSTSGITGSPAISSVLVSGTLVELTLASDAAYGDSPTVSYTRPGTNALRDNSGNLAVSFTSEAVINNIIQAANVVETYLGGDDFGNSLYLGGPNWRGFSYVASNNNKLISVKVRAFKNGTPPGSMYCKLTSSTGTHGTDARPDDIIANATLATSDAYANTGLTNSTEWITFTFSGAEQYDLVSGTTYCFIVEYTAATSGNYVDIAFDATPTSGANAIYSTNGTSWSFDTGNDCSYEITTNGTGGVVTPPSFSSGEIGNINDTTLEITFSQSLASGNVDGTHAMAASGGAVTLSNPTVVNGKLLFTTSRAIGSAETGVTYAYTNSGSYPLQNSTGAEVVSFTAQSVTNNVSGGAPVGILNVNPSFESGFTTAEWKISTQNTNDAIVDVVQGGVSGRPAARAGSYMLRTENTDVAGSNWNRCEVVPNTMFGGTPSSGGYFPWFTEFWMGMSLYLPNFDTYFGYSDVSWNTQLQFHSIPGDWAWNICSAAPNVFSVVTMDGYFDYSEVGEPYLGIHAKQIANPYSVAPSGGAAAGHAIPPWWIPIAQGSDVWVDFVFNFIISPDAGGKLDVWVQVNGGGYVKEIALTGANVYYYDRCGHPAVQESLMQMGIYKSPLISRLTTHYYDEIRFGNASSNFASVEPGQ
jgi:hypothetical protein